MTTFIVGSREIIFPSSGKFTRHKTAIVVGLRHGQIKSLGEPSEKNADFQDNVLIREKTHPLQLGHNKIRTLQLFQTYPPTPQKLKCIILNLVLEKTQIMVTCHIITGKSLEKSQNRRRNYVLKQVPTHLLGQCPQNTFFRTSLMQYICLFQISFGLFDNLETHLMLFVKRFIVCLNSN